MIQQSVIIEYRNGVRECKNFNNRSEATEYFNNMRATQSNKIAHITIKTIMYVVNHKSYTKKNHIHNNTYEIN